jgi:uncharacterized protein with HEPN domain
MSRENKDAEAFLEHVREAVEWIQEYTADMSKKEFMEDVKTQDAVIRRLEVIGEAIKNLPEEFRQEHDDEVWGGGAGMRDILIHQYFSVDLEIVWNTVEQTVPELKHRVEELLDR